MPSRSFKKSTSSGIEPGTIQSFAMTTPPESWLKANGAAVSRITYAALFAVIGTTYGSGDGSTTFNLPDLRGEFVRGVDDGRGVDSGRVLGSSQTGQNESHSHTGSTSSDSHNHTGSTSSAGNHTHSIPVASQGGITASDKVPTTDNVHIGPYVTTSAAGAHSHSFTTSSDSHSHTFTTAGSGGNEARPRNVALLYCIKT